MNEFSTSTASPDPFESPKNDTPPQSTLSKAARTIAEGFVLLIVAQALSVLLTLLGAKFFLQSTAQSQGVDQLLSRNPLFFVALAVIVAPVMEEAIFRGFPSLVMRAATRPESSARHVVWLLFGLASSLLFAAMHGVKSNAAGMASIAFQTLPVPQLAVGLWAWHVATLRGLRYSMLLHATFNGLAVLLALLALALGLKI
jgi:membrane protease YdiL (CAAX protease family)